MIRKAIHAMMLVLCAVAMAEAAEPKLLLHLPRSVQASGQELQLGQLGVLRGQDEALLAKASTLAMGRAPLPGEQIVIDRRTILSRLSACGIAARHVRITGAEQVAVTRNETLVAADKLQAVAEELLKEQPPADGATWRVARGPADIIIPTTEPVQLEACLVEVGSDDAQLVEVAVLGAKGELAKAQVLFKQVYEVRQSCAKRDIAAGEVLSADNVEVRTAASDSRTTTPWVSPFGKTAARAVSAGAVIAPTMLRSEAPAVLVERNATVQMKVAGSGFSITALGQALEEGRCGDVIRVRNVDSKRIVTARVAADGTVSPVSEKG